MSMPDALIVTIVGILIVMSELALLAIIIIIMSKIIRAMAAGKEKKAASKSLSQSNPESDRSEKITLPETQSAGSLNQHNIDDKTVAMLMAIVSDESGIPLNELRFKSIRAID